MSARKMMSYLSRLSPVPAFPRYTGPYQVGSVDVELPVSELDSPSPAPDAAENIHTIQFRVFYPATPDSDGPPIPWLPAPQRLHVAAYTQFLGLHPTVASVLSFFPRHLHYTSIPVIKNASLQPPDTPSGRWPVVIFSHGLGGSRNAYSQIAGSLASHGLVVICPEHRDGSAVLSLIRDPHVRGKSAARKARQVVPYVRIPHTQTPEIWRARDTQIRIRLWELGLLVDAILGLDTGAEEVVSSNMNGTTSRSALEQFARKMDVHEPGRVVFAGHSFGAATIVQLLKLTYYASHPDVAGMPDPVFTPRADSHIRHLITDKTPTVLLDLWCFPLVSATFSPLLRLPLPAYGGAGGGNSAGPAAVLAVESEAFYKWTEHLHCKARLLSAEPGARTVAAGPGPAFFYVGGSAHLSQSDFGVLFPWLCRRVFGAEDADRALRLNLRAVLQHLRANAVPVARTAEADLAEGPERAGTGTAGVDDDEAILVKSAENPVKGWCWIDIVGLGQEAGLTEEEVLARKEKADGGEVDEGEDMEQQMEGEMEPDVAPVEAGAPVGDVRKAVVGAASA